MFYCKSLICRIIALSQSYISKGSCPIALCRRNIAIAHLPSDQPPHPTVYIVSQAHFAIAYRSKLSIPPLSIPDAIANAISLSLIAVSSIPYTPDPLPSPDAIL